MTKFTKLILLTIGLTIGSNAQAPATGSLSCDKIIHKKLPNAGYEIYICYSYDVNGPLFTKYKILGDKVNEANIKKRPRFYREKSLPREYQVSPRDYTYSTDSNTKTQSFDRGHLAPDADFDYDKKDLLKVYTMANIVPQVSNFNRRVWVKPEKYERLVASKLDSVNILTGSLYEDLANHLVKKDLSNIPSSKKWSDSKKRKFAKYAKQLEDKNIVIPSKMYKILYNREHKFNRCFLYPNIDYKNKSTKMKTYVIDCKELIKKINNNYSTQLEGLF